MKNKKKEISEEEIAKAQEITPLEESAFAEAVDRIKSDKNFRTKVDCMAERIVYKKRLADATISTQAIIKHEDAVTKILMNEYNQGQVKSFVAPAEVKTARLQMIGAVALCIIAAVFLFNVTRGHEAVAVNETDDEKVTVSETPEALPEKKEDETKPIEQRVSKEERVEVYTAFFNKYNPELAGCAERMADHYRGLEAIAISGKETSFCKAGVARHNNCGGIKSSRKDREWRLYADKCDGLEDIAYLIERGDYAGKTIGQMNGRYCVGNGPRLTCIGWEEDIMQYVAELRDMMI